MKKDLLSIGELNVDQINQIFDLTKQIKTSPKKFSRVLNGKTLALIFQKPSNRTYVSFQVGMYQLGGNAVYLGPEQINLGVRETVHDVAKTLSRFAQGIVLRTFSHQNVLDMAYHASVPVINGLSDYSHPCQALADIYTIQEKLGGLKKVTLAYVGDGNNVCNSLIFICSKLGINFNIATPKGYQPDNNVLRQAQVDMHKSKAVVQVFTDPYKAVKGSDVVYTDVWASMGQEGEAKKRKQDFKGFQINEKLVSHAKKTCLIMHCLPAHRGEEISSGVLDSNNSIVFDQAENRLHVQKAILVKLLK